jgi:hypothetical protein
MSDADDALIESLERGNADLSAELGTLETSLQAELTMRRRGFRFGLVFGCCASLFMLLAALAMFGRR